MTKNSHPWDRYDWTFVINEETGGRSYYENVYKSRPVWPGMSSGVTIYFGVDTGYISRSEWDTYIRKHFNASENELLIPSIGLKGQAAKNYLPKVKHIICPWEEGEIIFKEWTLPKFWNLTSKIYPGFEKLCPGAVIAIISLVFNRGVSLVGARRSEMKALQPLIVKKDYKGMAQQFRSMKRLWASNTGVYKRREKEAKLIESCI